MSITRQTKKRIVIPHISKLAVVHECKGAMGRDRMGWRKKEGRQFTTHKKRDVHCSFIDSELSSPHHFLVVA